MLDTDNVFPDRKELAKRRSYRDNIIETAKNIDVEKIDYKNVDFGPQNQIIEQQKVYFWIRIYLKEEMDVQPNTDITLTYTPENESLQTKFICYAKKGHEKDKQQDVVNYNSEDDKRILCLMVDADRIDKHSDDIPFIRTLFKITRWYQPQILRLSEIKITDSNDRDFEFYDIEF
jgi:hypothetical protein